MCPACLATMAMIAASLTSTGAVAAIAIKKFGAAKGIDNAPAQTTTKEDRHG
jgi:hypothetical protein